MANDEDFNFVVKYCITINNLEFISNGMNSVFVKIKKNVSSEKIEVALGLYIVDLLKGLGRKLARKTRNLINENHINVADLLTQPEETLKKYLNEKWIQKIHDEFWTELLGLLDNVSTKRKPAEFYANLRDSITELLFSFEPSADFPMKLDLENTQNYLKLQCKSNYDLIAQFYKERMQTQENLVDCPMLTVISCFEKETLKVEVLNARKLPTIKILNPFVKVQLLLLENVLQKSTMFKTEVQRNTSFPLFDASFTL